MVAGRGVAGEWASLRPEDIRFDPAGREARVTSRFYHGRTVKLGLEIGGQDLSALIPATDTLPEAGETIRVSWDPARVHVMGSGA